MEWIAQIVVLFLAVITAGVKSLRFAPSELTDYELQRQVAKGRDAAIAEDRLRKERSLLLALQQVVLLLLMVIIIVILRGAYDFIFAVLFAFMWLIIVEFLGAQQFLHSSAEELADKYQMQILKVADFLRPVLKFITYKQLFETRQSTYYSKDEIVNSLEHDHGVLTKDEVLLVKSALSYGDKTIKDVMTPRSVVCYVEKTDTIGPVLLDKLHKSGQSRFPVVVKDLDHVVGMLYMHDLVPLKKTYKTVADAMQDKVCYVNEDKKLDHVLQAFLRTRRHLFIVVNEFEETTGVISIEDILEQLIGRKIVDEFDRYQDLRAVAKLAAAERQKSKDGERI